MTGIKAGKCVKVFLAVITLITGICGSVSAADLPNTGIRILPGQWRPHCAFEQIAWISPPWPCRDYVWLDFPEAIFTDSGLLYLSHVSPKFPVVFPDLPKVQWQTIPGGISYERTLANAIKFAGSVVKNSDSTGALLELYIENGSKTTLRNIKLQTCAYLRAVKEFSEFTADNKFVHTAESGWQAYDKALAEGRQSGRFRLGWRSGPPAADLPVMVTVSNTQQQLVALSWYDDTYSLVCNPEHPCLHADPYFPDLEPGQSATIRGELLFFEGTVEQFGDWFLKRYNRPKVELLWPDGAPGSEGFGNNEVEEIVNRSETIIDRSVSNVHRPSVTVYLPKKSGAARSGVIICPGGAYTHLAIDKEGYDVARWVNSLGAAAFVLKYRLRPHYSPPTPLQDAQRAVRMVRSRAKEWDVDPNKIGIIGFSAGAHLASLLGTSFQENAYEAKDAIDKASCRPDFMILGYGAAELSEQTQVTARTPPSFLFCSSDDSSMPPERSVNFYLALQKANVPAELHIYQSGGHGYGLGIRGGAVANWPIRCADWMRARALVNTN